MDKYIDYMTLAPRAPYTGNKWLLEGMWRIYFEGIYFPEERVWSERIIVCITWSYNTLCCLCILGLQHRVSCTGDKRCLGGHRCICSITETLKWRDRGWNEPRTYIVFALVPDNEAKTWWMYVIGILILHNVGEYILITWLPDPITLTLQEEEGEATEVF